MKKRIYLDYAATTPTDPEVVAAMKPYFSEFFGNPSSLHSFGQEAKRAMDEARERIAGFIGASAEEIVFSSGGSESNNTALKGIAYANKSKGNQIIISAIEHHSVSEPASFLKKESFEIILVPVDKMGIVNPEDVKKAITEKTILISVMQANNEIGTIQPIKEISQIAREKGIYFHTDAVQTLGHIPINVKDLGVDLLSASAHKLYGPKGIGFLYIKKGTKISSFIQGGDQEKRRRASTENVPGIVGFGRAVELAQKQMLLETKKLTFLRDKLIKLILETIPDVQLNGHPTQRLPNNVNISVRFVEGESMILKLDLEGIACSTGSACTSSSLEPSHVLLAIGLPHEMAHGSLRFTSGRFTQEKEIDYLLTVLPKIVKKLRAVSPLYKGGK